MPGSSRSFTYTLVPADEADREKLMKQARRIMGWACDGDKRITCHGVDGDALGVIQMNMTILGRDQWWSRQLAQDIVNMVTWGLKNPASMDLLSTGAPIHDRRGYAYGRVKQWRAQRSSS